MTPQRVVPVFQVTNLEASLEFYKKVLGFEEDFRFGTYSGVKLGAVTLHLTEQSPDGRTDFKKPIGSGIAYFFCDEVDSYYAEIKKQGATAKYPPQDFPYGMREFMVADLDGNHLAFGNEISTA